MIDKLDIASKNWAEDYITANGKRFINMLRDAFIAGFKKGAQLSKPNKWIPCSKRMPEKPEGYPQCEIRRTYFLVSLESGCVKTLAYEFDRDEWQITGSPVVAWQPLPEPWKGEKEKWICKSSDDPAEFTEELIHCKDCRHYRTDNPRVNGYHCCWRNHNIFPMGEDDYCSRAKRRNENQIGYGK